METMPRLPLVAFGATLALGMLVMAEHRLLVEADGTSPMKATVTRFADRVSAVPVGFASRLGGFDRQRRGLLGEAVDGYCWFPFVDSCDRDSMLVWSQRNIDPVGVHWLDERLERRPSSMSDAYARATRGAPAADPPAYRFQPPVAGWLAGWLPQMAHWDWRNAG